MRRSISSLLLALVVGCAGCTDFVDFFRFVGADVVRCGDGRVDADFGETCDRGSANEDASICSSTCDMQEVRAIAARGNQTCVVVSTSPNETRLRCWGDNEEGQLGLGDTRARGKLVGEMGAGLVDVSLGAGHVVRVALGSEHSCVVLRDETGDHVKCWGSGGSGQLGTGNTMSFGEAPERLPSAAPNVALPPHGEVLELALGQRHSCALLRISEALAQVACWGDGAQGQLGSGDTKSIGAEPGTIPIVNVSGEGVPVSLASVVAGLAHTCVLSTLGDVYCWGRGTAGEVGQGAETTLTVPYRVELGTDPSGKVSKAKEIAAGDSHTCALLEGGSVKCWGLNHRGQLGLDDALDRGDEPGEMGDDLPSVDLGSMNGMSKALRAVAIRAGGNRTCVALEDGSIKCWGENTDGALGIDDTLDRGDGLDNANETEMGDALPRLDLGKGLGFDEPGRPKGITMGTLHTCAIVNDGSVRCWGSNAFGQLGLEGTSPVGDEIGDMGAGLPTVRSFSDEW